MRRILICFLCLFVYYLWPRDVEAQVVSAGKRDSLAADSLVKLRPWLNGWRTTTLNRVITAIQVPHEAARVDTVTIERTRVDTVLRVIRDTVRITTTRVDTVYVRDSTITVNAAPVAAFTRSCSSATRTCSVNASGSTDDGGAANLRYAWSFGDGASATGVAATRTYAAAGTYAIRLTVTDAGGLTASTSQIITLAATTTNVAPVARMSVSCAQLTRQCALNASASTDDKAVTRYDISWGDGSAVVQSTVPTATRTYAASGQYRITLTARDAEGLTSVKDTTVILADPIVVPPPPPDTTTGIATPPELPRTIPAFTVPAPTRVVNVPAGANLQTYLTNAVRGDEIRLAPGATYSGNFTFSGCGAGWITVTGTAVLPPAGTRVTPTTAAPFGKISTPNTEPALQSRGAACNWRFVGVEVIGALETTEYLAYGLVRFGEGSVQTTVAQLPYNLILERSYVHGKPNHNNTRCVVLNSGAAVVRDSWISDCHARGSDSQSIEGWNGPGPFLIENNTLEGAGENVMFGGADPGIIGLIPSDITIRRNHFNKPLAWKGGPWSVKNGFELKNARRVLVEANVFDVCSWPASQEGMCIVIKSSKDASPTATWQGTTDLTFRWNIVRSAAVGLNIQARDGPTELPVARVRVENNLFERIGAEGRGALMLLTHDLTDVAIVSNTFLHDPAMPAGRGSSMTTDYANGAARRLEWRSNVMMHGAYGFFYNGLIGSAAMQGMAGDGSWRFSGNVMIGGTDLASRYTTGNTWLATLPATFTAGADLGELTRRTQGVVQ